MSEPEDVIPYERLPEGFAERVEDPPEDPAEPRPAATIVLLRSGPAPGDPIPRPERDGPPPGLEVLLVRRSRSAGFVPGAYVFPGGTVDRDDASADLLERLDGLDEEDAARRLGLPGADPPAVAYYVAALREAFEETGVLVGRTDAGRSPPGGRDDPRVEACRQRVLEDEESFPDVLDQLGCTMDGRAVEYIAHWITPVAEPRRYDTRFFAAAVPAGSRAVVDAREMTDALWISPAGALERHRRDELPMIFPTIKTLESLRGYRSPGGALTAFRSREIPTIVPRLVRTPEGIGSVIPDRS